MTLNKVQILKVSCSVSPNRQLVRNPNELPATRLGMIVVVV